MKGFTGKRNASVTVLAVPLSLLGMAAIARPSGIDHECATTPTHLRTRVVIDGDALPHRDIARQMTMDHVLVRSDFIGELTVESVRPSSDAGTVLVGLTVDRVWYTRWPNQQKITIGIASQEFGEFSSMLAEDSRLVVMLAGGPWRESPFTYGANSVFRVTRNETVQCVSGNPLFGVAAGFACSIQEYMHSQPITVEQMRIDTLSARASAEIRLAPLALHLDTLRRPLTLRPTPESEIDRTLIENESYR